MQDCANCESCKFTGDVKDIYYEIHITVNYNPKFVDFCKSFGIKVVHIEMGDEIPTQLMTSHSIKDNLIGDGIIAVMKQMSEMFKREDFEVIREKIETVPWHPDIDCENYFESHLAYETPINDEVCKLLRLHKSRNLMKTDSGSTVQMYTLRHRTPTPEAFTALVDFIVDIIDYETGLKPVKKIIEYALYDSNEALDDKWLKNLK